MPTSTQSYPEFITNPVRLTEVAQNFRAYAEQVAFYAKTSPNCWEYPWNFDDNPQMEELGGFGRYNAILGDWGKRQSELFSLAIELTNTKTPEDAITFSLFAALYIESLDEEEQS